MSDTLAKIRQEIEKEIKQSIMADRFDHGWLAGLGIALAIIDKHLADAERKPRGEWKHDGGTKHAWYMSTKAHLGWVEVHENGSFSSVVVDKKTHRRTIIDTFETITAAQLAAEEAMDEMEKKQ